MRALKGQFIQKRRSASLSQIMTQDSTSFGPGSSVPPDPAGNVAEQRPLIEVGMDGGIRSWNLGAERVYGYAAGELAGRSILELMPQEKAVAFREHMERLKRGESFRHYKTVHLRKNKPPIDVSVNMEPKRDLDGEIRSALLVVQPLDKPKSIHKVLWESDEWTRAIVETAVDGIITIDDYGRIEYFNPAAERLFGYKAAEVQGENVRILMPSPYREEHDNYLAKYRKTGAAKIIGIGRELVGRHKDGTVFPIELAVSEVRMGNRRLFTGIVHDISQRKQVQQEKERVLRDLNKRNIETTCLYRVGEVVRSREMLSDIFREVVKLVRPALLYPGIARVRITCDNQVYRTTSFDETPWFVSASIMVAGRKRGDVEVYYLEERPPQEHGPFLGEEKDLIEAIARTLGELIERREAETKVIQASKLASIGELAAGVGHEINNPVNSIINCADIIIEMTGTDSQERQFAELARSEAERIAKIARDLLMFSRQDRETHSPARLCDLVESVLSLTRKKIDKSNVELEVDIPEDLPELHCRSEQLQQVIMNLIINALYALDERFPKGHPDKKLCMRAAPMEYGGRSFVRITVEDFGSGIEPAHMDRLFDPFFTTKGRDRGTGLGLSVSDGIVKDHGGTISVESEPGRFSRFHVDLPLDSEAVETRTGEE